MTANSRNPEIDPSLESQTISSMDKTVSETFEELFVEISSERAFHPSETFNKKKFENDYCDTKIYHFINSYHAFCKLCEQHFYRLSVAEDVNSFFQKHLNTSYHRQNRALRNLPDDVPMFTWEEKFYTGQCNVCDMTGLNSYFLKTGTDILTLMKLHVCTWSTEHRQSNEELLRKLNLLKKYFGLKIFQQKYLTTLQGREVCLLCRLSFPAAEKNGVSHLSSDIHYQNFCALLRTVFNFEPKDVLNGFNLEKITRWVIAAEPPPVAQFTDFDERKLCLEQSNNHENPYFDDNGNFSFSPKFSQIFFQNKDSDFIRHRECLLCNVEFRPGHANSKMHLAKAANLDASSFDTPEKHAAYLQNRERRLYIMKTIKELSSGVLEPSVSETPTSKDNPFPEIYFKTLLQEKLKLVNQGFTVESDGSSFCQICDAKVPRTYERAHSDIPSHRYYCHVWNYIMANLECGKIMEPFIKIRNIFACLLCGVKFQRQELWTHLKHQSHTRKFEKYCAVESNLSISSMILFRRNFCYCTVCNANLNRKGSIKKTLANIVSHWPCRVDPKSNEPRPKRAGDVAEDKKPAGGDRIKEASGEAAVVWSSVTESESCANKTVDFKRVEETVEGILVFFESKLMNAVLNKAENLIKNLRNSKSTPAKESLISKAERQSTAQKKVSSSDSFSTSPSLTASPKKEVGEKQEGVNAEATIQKTADPGGEHEELVSDKDKENFNKEQEVLFIEGLPNASKKVLSKELHAKFSEFGKIIYIGVRKSLKKKKIGILAFEKAGVAETLAKGPDIYLNNNRVYLIPTTMESSQVTGMLPISLNKDLIPLLENPQLLTDFVLNMVVQAMKASESPLEIKREELVCKTIISAVYECFPQARCYPFGSRLSGLVSEDSDLDVFLDCGGMYDGFKNTSPKAARKLVNQVEMYLRKKEEITNFVLVRKARVPIISFLHKPTSMHCDLSFKNGLSVQKTLLIKHMMSLDFRVKPLILFLRHWAKLNKLHGPPFFSSFALAMLVIFFLEQLEKPVLPTVESLQASFVGQRRTIAGWDCSINMSTCWKSENEDSVFLLLAELFEFYSQFRYDKNIISPLTGKPLLKETYCDSGFRKLPLAYKRHVLNISLPTKSSASRDIPIVIVDPFDVSHIMTKGFSSKGLKLFVHFCGITAVHLRKGIPASQAQQ